MATREVDIRQAFWLLCRAGGHLCALPVDDVVETARLLPIELLPGMPHFVMGISIIRGTPVPIIDAGALLGGANCRLGRWVTLIAGDRLIALTVQDVLGVRAIDAESLSALPPLLQAAAGDVIETIRTLDGELLLVLDAARIVPEAVLDDIASPGAES